MITVELVDKMGNDLLVANAAWVSTDRWATIMPDRGSKLVCSLAEHRETTPFRHPHLSLRIHAPVFVARQLVKHQVGLSWSEESLRYLGECPEFYQPTEWYDDSGTMMQIGNNPLNEWIVKKVEDEYDAVLDIVKSTYDRWATYGVARERRRILLPVAHYTTWLWTGSLLAFAHVVNLRDSEKAQLETRLVAKEIRNILIENFPIASNALFWNK